MFNTWLKFYTSHSELKDSGKGMNQTKTKGRKTTVEERNEIVKASLLSEKKELSRDSGTILGILTTSVSVGT